MKKLSEHGKKEVVKAVMIAIYAGVSDYGTGFDSQYFEEKTRRLTGSMNELGVFDNELQAMAQNMIARIENEAGNR